MIFTASWATSARPYTLFQRFAPSNILIRHLHTRTAIKWRPPVGMAAAILYGLLMLATATVVRKDGPGWVDLVVLLAFWNTAKFASLIPVSLLRAPCPSPRKAAPGCRPTARSGSPLCKAAVHRLTRPTRLPPTLPIPR